MKLVLYPNEILRQKTEEVEQIDGEIQTLIQEMYQVLEKEGGLGLAAPQVGRSQAIFIVQTEKEKYTFINPEIIEKEGTQYNYEGCLSLPGVQERVYRSYRVVIRALNEQGKPFTLDTQTNDLLAQVIQHEYDHIQGTLMIDHLDEVQKGRARVQLKRLTKLEKLSKKVSGKMKEIKRKPKKH